MGQFSILPLLEKASDKVDIGISALGWGQDLRTIELSPENRAEVAKAFFAPVPPAETLEDEAKRYTNVENKMIHIQIEMKVPAEPKKEDVKSMQANQPNSDVVQLRDLRNVKYSLPNKLPGLL